MKSVYSHLRLRTGIFLFFGLLFAILVYCPAQAEEGIVYLDITASNFRKLKLAVPPFTEKGRPEQATETGRKMADLLGRSLAFHGFVELINPASYNGSQSANWPAVGAELVILGQYENTAEGINLEIRLNNIQAASMVLGRRYQAGSAGYQEVLRKFCDDAVLELTGERGISQSRIAFVANETGHKEVYLADILGDEIRRVTQHEFLALNPRISPDGRWLAYTSYHRGNPNLYLTELKSLRSTRAISRRKGLNVAPAWAPDSQSIVLTLSKDGNPDLYLIDLNGKETRRLTRGAGINVSPSWSPDGKRLAFVSDRSGTPQVYVMDLASQSVKRITALGGENTTPSWSPKGDLIAYTGRVNGSYQILLIKPEGGNPVQLTHGAMDHESPSWSPDGRQLVFARKRGGKQELCAIFKNGSGLRPLFPLRRGSQSAPHWSPHLEN